MSRVAAVVFAVLVAATFGAFFLAQRLKHSPTVVQQFTVRPQLSPNRDGRFETAAFSFKLKQADDVTLDVIDREGNPVRRLLDNGFVPAYAPRRFTWNGRGADGRVVPDGKYRLRIALRRQGRAVIGVRSVTVDTTPPVVRVTGIGPERRAPEILPTRSGAPVTVHFNAPGSQAAARRRPDGTLPSHKLRVTIFRTDGSAATRVTSSGYLKDGTNAWSWDGTVGGRRVRPGTYLAVVEARDGAGNIGTSVPERRGVPLLPFGRKLPGAGGITVRYLGVAPPSAPVVAGERAQVFVDARGARWRWSLRRVGGPKQPIARAAASAAGPVLRVRAPRRTGVYLLTVATRAHQQRVPLIVQERVPAGRVLVVLPWLTWQGRNALDDDGDGRANTLDAGVGVRADRVLVGDGLPAGFGVREAPVLGFLDRTRRRYDVTTDLALARGTGPRLAAFRGVLLPGDTRWLTSGVAAALRRFAQGGGTVVSLGTGSLRRQVTLTPRGRLVQPTAPTAADLFGATLRPVTGSGGTLTLREDHIDLFRGGVGTFPGVGAYEATASLGSAREVAAAVTKDDRPVVVAARFGKGLVIRPGIRDFAQRLMPRPESAALMNRLWTIMAQGAPTR